MLITALTRWLGRLSVRRKLLLIYALDLTAVIYITGILVNEKLTTIEFTHKEIVGSQYIATVRDLKLFALQNAAQEAPEPLSRAFQGVRTESDNLLSAAQPAELFRQALTDRVVAANDDVEAATLTLISASRRLITLVGNQSNLILDPDLDSYYAMSLVVLRFPDLAEVLYQTRALVDRVTAVDLASAQREAELLIVLGRIESIARAVDDDYTQAVAAAPPRVQSRLQPHQIALSRDLENLMATLRTLVEDSGGDRVVARAMGAAYGQSLRVLERAWVDTQMQLDVLLHARVDAQQSRMQMHLSTALGLLLLIAMVVFFVARQIARPITRLAGLADRVQATGDYTQRMEWPATDEIGSLVKSFNGMLGQLDQQRVVEKERAAQARGAQAQREMVEAMPIAMVITSIPEHQVLHANEAAQPWLAGRKVDPWAVGLESGVRLRFFQRLADGGSVDEFEVRWLAGAEPSWAVLSARRLSFQGRDAVLTTFTPINVLKVMEQRLELWSKVFEASSESIMIMDADFRILSVNRAFCRSTSYDFYEVVGERLGLLLGDGAPQAVEAELIATAVEQRDSWQGEVQVRCRDGSSYPAWLMISAVRDLARTADREGRAPVSQYIGISVDVTDRKRTEARVRFLAEHDVLTQLPNRATAMARLEEAVAEAKQLSCQAAVLFLDLDRFKSINDALGHHVGDALLRSVADRLQRAVRAGDTVSRLGGHEFVVVMRAIDSEVEVRELVERRLIPEIRATQVLEGHELRVSCSVGIAVCPQDGTDVEELMRRADAAMYAAKAAGRDQARFFAPAMEEAVQQRQQMERLLATAVQRGELSLAFQPRVLAFDHAVVGVEALLRWHSAELGFVSPATFIPVAEETGLIRPIGLWVLQQAALQIAAWTSPETAHLRVSVNLSATQLSDPQLPIEVDAAIKASGCDPSRLELELTESQLMENAVTAVAQLQALRDLGVRLSVDDFGTGYSSLAYLKRFPIDALKIDKSFVLDLLDDSADLAIVRTIIVLGHSLNLEVVAEGVETGALANRLLELDCDELQGYHFAKPMPASAFEAWLKQHASAPQTGRGGERERRRLSVVNSAQ